ncbi:MAG: hypothetical protein HQL62_09190, partial [Magnetococcales bacterium]|nr:hypothetical protein [Magnetococcales bacterium]
KIFNTTLLGYGFVLVTPGFLLLVGMLTGAIPRWLAARHQPSAIRFVQGLYVVFVLFVILGVWKNSSWMYWQMHFSIGKGSDRFLTFSPSISPNALVHARFDMWAMEKLRPNDTLLVLPEGLMINFLYRVVNSTQVHSFLPPDIATFGEDYFIEKIQQGRPRFILFWYRPTPEYGYPQMGGHDGFGQKITAWLRQAYRPVYYQENRFSLDDPGKKGLIVLQIRDDIQNQRGNPPP